MEPKDYETSSRETLAGCSVPAASPRKDQTMRCIVIALAYFCLLLPSCETIDPDATTAQKDASATGQTDSSATVAGKVIKVTGVPTSNPFVDIDTISALGPDHTWKTEIFTYLGEASDAADGSVDLRQCQSVNLKTQVNAKKRAEWRFCIYVKCTFTHAGKNQYFGEGYVNLKVSPVSQDGTVKIHLDYPKQRNVEAQFKPPGLFQERQMKSSFKLHPASGVHDAGLAPTISIVTAVAKKDFGSGWSQEAQSAKSGGFGFSIVDGPGDPQS